MCVIIAIISCSWLGICNTLCIIHLIFDLILVGMSYTWPDTMRKTERLIFKNYPNRCVIFAIISFSWLGISNTFVSYILYLTWDNEKDGKADLWFSVHLALVLSNVPQLEVSVNDDDNGGDDDDGDDSADDDGGGGDDDYHDNDHVEAPGCIVSARSNCPTFLHGDTRTWWYFVILTPMSCQSFQCQCRRHMAMVTILIQQHFCVEARQPDYDTLLIRLQCHVDQWW